MKGHKYLSAFAKEAVPDGIQFCFIGLPFLLHNPSRRDLSTSKTKKYPRLKYLHAVIVFLECLKKFKCFSLLQFFCSQTFCAKKVVQVSLTLINL